MINLLLLAFLPSVLGGSYCLSKDDNPYLMFGERTSYRSVYGKNADTSIPNCRPLQLWFISKHGALLPSEDEVRAFSKLPDLRDQIIRNHNGKNGELCREDLDKLQKWKMEYKLEKSNKLSGHGEVDMLNLGERLRASFKELLNTTYTHQRFPFRSTPTPKIQLSELGLALGIFDDEILQALTAEEGFNQPLPNCTSWIEKNRKWDGAEVRKFEQSNVMTSMIDRVRQRLGFRLKQSSDYINITSVMNIWAICAYERGRGEKAVSPWCAAFNTDDLKIMEYYEDLKHYHSLGKEQEVLHKMGCPLLKDMMDHFSQLTRTATDLQTAPKGIFYVVDNTTLLGLLARMGIGQTAKPLTSDNYQEMNAREWRTSKLIPASGNLGAAFYKCDGDQYKVKFFQNEKVLYPSYCDKEGVCTWTMLVDKFKSIIESPTCNYKFCKAG